MAEKEKDPERELRVTALMNQLLDSLRGQDITDVQCALGNASARLALMSSDPEEFMMSTVESIFEIYRAVRHHVRSGKPPEVVN